MSSESSLASTFSAAMRKLIESVANPAPDWVRQNASFVLGGLDRLDALGRMAWNLVRWQRFEVR